MKREIKFDENDVKVLAQPLVLLEGGRKRLSAPNRIAYQPMEANDALEYGRPSKRTVSRYIERARGTPGIEFVEAMAVSPDAKARERQVVINESTRSALENLVKEYRKVNSDTPLIFQLTHSGIYAREPVTPHPAEGREARLLTDKDMAQIQENYVEAVKIAFECGADGIDFKHCHGYLCGSVLRPLNRERDGWSWGGGSIHERSRFFIETLKMMQEEVSPKGFLYSLRISAYEGIEGGFGSVSLDSEEADEEMTELREFCRIAENTGIRLLNQSLGVPEETPWLVRQTRENLEDFRLHEKYAGAIKDTVSIPVAGSGYSILGYKNSQLGNIVETGARNIRECRVDFIGVGRQSLADPQFARKLLTGSFEEINWDTACSNCATALRSGIPAGCPVYDGQYREVFRTLG